MPIDASLATDDALAAKKAAKAEYDRQYRAKNAEKIKAQKKAWGQSEKKKEYDKKWAADHKERVLEIKAAYRARHPEKLSAYYELTRENRLARARSYYQENADTIRAKTKAWREANPQKASALAGKRVRAVRRATPSWADQDAMKAVYAYARANGLEVDHVIPIQGKNVSGLHVEGNLRAIPRKENRQKGARHAN